MEATTLTRAGYTVSVICPRGKGFETPYECIDGVHIYRHPLPVEADSAVGYLREYLTSLWWELRLSIKIRRKHGFDVVHVCNPPDLLFLVAGLWKALAGARMIFDQHDLVPELWESKFAKRGLFYHLLRLAERATFAAADVVISTNESYKQVALTRGKKDPRDVFVVRSGPDLSRFQRVAANPSYRRGKKYLVGYVGVMGAQEGIDYLIRAVQHLVVDRGRRDTQFMLIGGGTEVASLKALTHDLGLDEFIEFTGRVPDAELLERLSSCDIAVNPDPDNPLNRVSTMNKILEYMALGIPVVQFDLLEGRRSAGDASAYVEPNQSAAFGDAVAALLDDPDARARMGAEGMRRMQDELEWRHQAPKLLAAYATALGSSPR